MATFDHGYDHDRGPGPAGPGEPSDDPGDRDLQGARQFGARQFGARQVGARQVGIGQASRLSPTVQTLLGAVAVAGSLLVLVARGPLPPLLASIVLAGGITALGRGVRRLAAAHLRPKAWWRPLVEEIAPQEALRGGVLVLSTLMVLAPLSSLSGLPWQIVPLGLLGGLLAAGSGTWVRVQRERTARADASPVASGVLWVRAVTWIGTSLLLLGLVTSYLGSVTLASALWTVVALVTILATIAAARLRFLPDP